MHRTTALVFYILFDSHETPRRMQRILDWQAWGGPPGRSQSCAGWADQTPSRNLPLPRPHTGRVQRGPKPTRYNRRQERLLADWPTTSIITFECFFLPLRAQSGHCTGCEDLWLYSAWCGRKAQTWSRLHCSMMWDGWRRKERPQWQQVTISVQFQIKCTHHANTCIYCYIQKIPVAQPKVDMSSKIRNIPINRL